MFGQPAQFADRVDAGRRLAAALGHYRGQAAIVLALPRGGVPVAYEVAKALAAPLGLLLVRKIGAPGQPELALGAVVDGRDPQVVLNDELVRAVGVDAAWIEAEKRRLLAEIERRRQLYLGGGATNDLAGRTAIVVDDGIATGATVKAALQGVARSRPARLVLAVPVAPADSLRTLSGLADDIVCLETPASFYAVGAYYRNFAQTTDDEVVRLLAAARGWAPAADQLS